MAELDYALKHTMLSKTEKGSKKKSKDDDGSSSEVDGVVIVRSSLFLLAE